MKLCYQKRRKFNTVTDENLEMGEKKKTEKRRKHEMTQ